MKDFTQKNKEFWQNFPAKDGSLKILIEEPLLDIIVHPNAIFSLILNQAKALKPVWLYAKGCNIELLRSYVPNAELLEGTRPSLFNKFKAAIISAYKLLRMLVTKDILSFSYDGVKYGDIAYDAYLSRNQAATIRKIDLKMFIVIYACIIRHIQIKNILKSSNYVGVLVSHQVTISSGVMLRTALRYGYKGYLRAGHRHVTLQCLEKLEEVYDYEYKPSQDDVDSIISKMGNRLDEAYEAIFNRYISGIGSKDAVYAFSKDNKFYTDRRAFNKDHGLSWGKKNIFVMLHAFNDYPHSHFRWMVFKDYYDWFKETLVFAKKFDKVNWIFKQHPAIRHYVARDVKFKEIFADCPSNVLYIDEKNQIDTRSLMYISDAVITCIGSAGFELPAMAAIPAVTAGDNFYTGLGFVLEPGNRKEYFETLSNIHKIGCLNTQQQRKARAAYIYIYYFSTVDMSACPVLSHDDEKDKNINKWYWKRVGELYDTCGERIKTEASDYIFKVSVPHFKRLNRDLRLPSFSETGFAEIKKDA